MDISSQDFRNVRNIETFLSYQCNKLGLNSVNFSDDNNMTKGVLNSDEEEFENEVDQFCKTIIVINKVDLVPNSDMLKMMEVFSDADVKIGRYNPFPIETVEEKNKLNVTELDKIGIGLAVDRKSDNVWKKTRDNSCSSCCDVSMIVDDDCDLSSEVNRFRKDSNSAQSVQEQENIR